MTAQTVWIGIGFLGQALFSARFLIQWLASERRRESVVPHAFWWFSLAGGLTLLAYAVWRGDPVFVLGQGLGLAVYGRNLVLIRRHRRAQAA
ncbi:lipid-A-disaccharide synthase N-terminal domain-containing protein [Paracoccus shandongensis]|uniref:lipid-A-disaccharide synthase N-terminal domain-containing protein n=1 Tax=Paracoccus shandongensis TaxID=2816048 RepID=UPI001A8CEF0A|nr:lipid-A-disaccharide synthase N-terminal domain-containing protein [Paracoccus shandongensis]